MHQPFYERQKSYTVSTSTTFVAFEFIIGGIVKSSINMNKKQQRILLLKIILQKNGFIFSE
jgi:hypothetical protein